MDVDKKANEEYLRRCANLAPLGTINTPKEIANCLLFLASNDSSFTSGEIMVVDSGSSLAKQGFQGFLKERLADFEAEYEEQEWTDRHNKQTIRQNTLYSSLC